MGNLKNKAYDQIKAGIISCRLLPGAFIDINTLTGKLGMSRTPVREAIMKLEQEGLIQVVSQKGILIQNITIKDIRNIYEARQALEPQIILMYGTKFSKDALQRCREKLLVDVDRLPMEQAVELDDLMHKTLVEQTENEYFIKFFNQLSDQNRRVQYMTRSLTQRRVKNQEAHLKILDTLLEGRIEQAADQMKEHLHISLEDAFSSMTS